MFMRPKRHPPNTCLWGSLAFTFVWTIYYMCSLHCVRLHLHRNSNPPPHRLPPLTYPTTVHTHYRFYKSQQNRSMPNNFGLHLVSTSASGRAEWRLGWPCNFGLFVTLYLVDTQHACGRVDGRAEEGSETRGNHQWCMQNFIRFYRNLCNRYI